MSENRGGRGGRSGGGRGDGSGQPRSRGPGPSHGGGRGGDQNMRGGAQPSPAARAAPGAPGSGSPMDAHSTRLAYANASMIGKNVRVQVNKGGALGWYEGMFHDWNLKSAEGIEVTLKMAHKAEYEKGFTQPLDSLVIKANEFVQMVADQIELNKDTRVRNSQGKFTDTEISGGMGGSGERELVPFQMDTSVDLPSNTLDQGGQGWDQFKVNKERFGVESGYKEEYYTTAIPQNLTAEERRKAEKIAAEIDREQRKAMGGKHRASDETEAAGDDQGDEWASDVRAEDGTVRGSYHPQATKPSVEPKKPAWGGGVSLADKLKTQKASEQAVMVNDPAIISTSVPPPSASPPASTSPKGGAVADSSTRYSAVDATLKDQKAQRKELQVTGARGVPQSGKTSKTVQALSPDTTKPKLSEEQEQQFASLKQKQHPAVALDKDAQVKDFKKFSRDLDGKSPKTKPEPAPSGDADPASMDLSAKPAEEPKPSKKTLNVSAAEFVPGGGGGFGSGGTGFVPGGGGGMGAGYSGPQGDNMGGGNMGPPGGMGMMGGPMGRGGMQGMGMGPGGMMGGMGGGMGGMGGGMGNMEGGFGMAPMQGHQPMPMHGQGNFNPYHQMGNQMGNRGNMNMMNMNMMGGPQGNMMGGPQNMPPNMMHQGMMPQGGGGRGGGGMGLGPNNMR